jgi:DNA end-binding protein Ku
MTAPFDITRYKDEYKEKLRAIIDEKVAGKEPAPRGEAPRATKVTDLMKVLERSLKSKSTKRPSKKKKAA